MMAVRASEVAHVFDDAEHFNVNLRKHLESFARILKADVARSGNNYGSCKRHRLHQRDDYIAGTGRQIHDQVVEFAPIDLLKKLANDLVQHWPAHHHRLVSRGYVADRDRLDAVCVVRLNLIFGAHSWLLS